MSHQIINSSPCMHGAVPHIKGHKGVTKRAAKHHRVLGDDSDAPPQLGERHFLGVNAGYSDGPGGGGVTKGTAKCMCVK